MLYNKKIIVLAVLVVALTTLIIGCGWEVGPDAISENKDNGSYRGSFSTENCAVCHLAPGNQTSNPLITNGTGADGVHVVHYSTMGIDCDMCHLNYNNSGTHFDGTLDTHDPAITLVLFNTTTNPNGVWDDTLGQCLSLDCHGPDDMDWNGLGGWTLPVCNVCHASVRGARRAVFGTTGDFALNTSTVSSHAPDTADPTDAQCSICHDMSKHMAGDVRLLEGDTSATIIYNATDPASAEPFCLSCHDSDGAMSQGISNMTPFNDGNTLGVIPYKMSVEIKDRWNRAYGHRREGLTCIGSGEPNTGCHSNGHGSKYVGLLTKQLKKPNATWADVGPFKTSLEPNYALCFECHASYPNVTKEVIFSFLDVGEYANWGGSWWGQVPTSPYNIPATSNFCDNDQGTGLPYDDHNGWVEGINLHYFHVGDWYDNWHYRGLPASGPELATGCIACHDMHGSDTQWGFMYDELQYAQYNGVGSDKYGRMGINDFTSLYQFPINCSEGFNCHMIFGTTSNWFTPTYE